MWLCGGDCEEEEEEEKMMRTRLLWFGVGFTTSAAVVSHFVWKDLWSDRHALASHMTHQFDALQARLSTLESTLPNHTPVSDHDQVKAADSTQHALGLCSYNALHFSFFDILGFATHTVSISLDWMESKMENSVLLFDLD